MHSWLPPHWLSNQHHCITCTLPSSQSANRVMCSTIHHLTCKTVFLRNSPLTPNINYWSYGDKTCVKLRQCVQLTCLDIKGTKWLQSYECFQHHTGTTLCSCTDILVVRHLVYKGGAPYESRTSRKTIRLLSAK